MRFLWIVWALVALSAPARADGPIRLWHAYTGQEEQALREVVTRYTASHPQARVELLAIPFGSYASKLESSIAVGRGPDLFIDAHERLPQYFERHLVAPTEARDLPAHFAQAQLETLSREGRVYGLPLSLKAAVLFVNTALVPDPSALRALEDLMDESDPKGAPPYALAMQADDPYYLAGLLHGEGSGLLDEQGNYLFEGDGAVAVLSRLRSWTSAGFMPKEPSGDLVKRLFGAGQARALIGGPWLAADFPKHLTWVARTLPPMVRGGKAPRPFVTIESLFRAQTKASPEHARKVADFSAFVAYGAGATIRAQRGGQVVAALGTTALPGSEASLASVVRAQALIGVPMPTHPNMRRVWEPSQRAAKRALRGDPDIAASLALGRRLFEEAIRPLPARSSPTPLILLFSLLTVAGAFWLFKRAQDPELRKAVRASLPAYAYVTHAVVAVALLVVLPLVVGALTSLYAGQGRDMYFVGLANYRDILTARGGPLFAPGSFYLVLAVTILWTVSNLVLHVVIGVALALLLQKVTPGLSRIYRVILILPWAVPSYVTALSWKGMFHQQLGAINGILRALGAEPVNWFAQWSTAFAANLATNAWLGFPFMMVVTLGALAAIPRELYEAAEVDGASEFDQARLITLPMIRPMLVPAMAMGAVWTFNMFNVIFLVSGGEPEGTTEILVSEAYRWAFTRSSQYGYAAAYAVLIFGLLLMGTRLLGGHSEARHA